MAMQPHYPWDEELVDSLDSPPSKTAATPTRILFAHDQQPQFSPAPSRDAAAQLPIENVEEQARLQREREEDESLELARRLMAEEAMASYQGSFQLLRESANQLSQEDYDALQNALEEEQHEQVAEFEDEQGELSYDALLQLGERIGDVKAERWAFMAENEIEKLPCFQFVRVSLEKGILEEDGETDDSELKCLVCQCEYDETELLRRLPCGHCFHADCVGQWLKEKDVCPYCRQCIVATVSTE